MVRFRKLVGFRYIIKVKFRKNRLGLGMVRFRHKNGLGLGTKNLVKYR